MGFLHSICNNLAIFTSSPQFHSKHYPYLDCITPPGVQLDEVPHLGLRTDLESCE